MTFKSKWLAVSCTLALLLSAGCAQLKSRDEMNKGVQAYKNNKYSDAVNHFKQAVSLDPSNKNAQLYLATSYMIQWVPGADSSDNKKNLDMARKTFQDVLAKDPTNSLALASMASMSFNSASANPGADNDGQRKAALEEAKKWNQRRIEVDPKDAEAYYYLGVIDWSDAFPAIRAARSETKLNPNDPGPLKDPKIRQDLIAKYLPNINQGIEQLQKCLAIDKENEDAMSYLNLLLREKAVLEDSPDTAKADVAQAESWSNKSIEMKRIKASRPAKKTENT